ncbi:acyltransferase domain-containing protein [Nocardia niigatensis]
MTISYLLGGQIPLETAFLMRFYDRFSAIRAAYRDVSTWTGFTVDELLTGDRSEDGELVQSFGALRQGALIVGMHDVLGESGIFPDAVGGLSLGGLLSATLSGGVARRELFGMLHHQRSIPSLPPGEPEQTMAVAALTMDDDPETYYGTGRPGVYLAADYDVAAGGDRRVIVLSGYREALTALVAEQPRKMKLLDEYVGAFHSPLVQHVADFMAAHVADMTFHAPRIVLCSAHSAGAVTTADGVREFVTHNYVRPVGIKPLMTQVARISTTTAIGLGPGLPQAPEGGAAESIRLTSVYTPDDLEEAAATLVRAGAGRIQESER